MDTFVPTHQICGDAEDRLRSGCLLHEDTDPFITAETLWNWITKGFKRLKWIHGNLEFRQNIATPLRILVVVMMSLLLSTIARGQGIYADPRPRLLLDAEMGSQTSLGYKFPSISVGPSVEVPIASRFEFQSSGTFSPDNKAITNDGKLASASGSMIAFATERVGFIATLERSWLWTSQFDKVAWYPAAGVVLRNDYFGHGRLYATYTFATGCQWATANNPCTLQSNRLQGLTLRQEIRSRSHMRWGLQSGLYHFCDQSNPNEPQLARNCHWGVTALAIVRFEFHFGSTPRFARADPTETDNF